MGGSYKPFPTPLSVFMLTCQYKIKIPNSVEYCLEYTIELNPFKTHN